MKYTRYNIKKKSNKKIIVSLLMIILLILVGVSVKNNKTNNKNKDSITKETNAKKNIKKNSNEHTVKKFYALQCGVFLSKENADTLVNTLKPYGNAFVVKKDENYKVILGLYSDKDVKKVIDSLNSKSIQNNKITYEIIEEDLCNVEISELINANLEVLNKFLDKEVKAVKTENLKKWSSGLKPVDEKSKNIAMLKNLKDYVNKLPKEIKRENVSNGYNLIYNCINSLK